MAANQNRGDIQGLRALSVLLVISYHSPYLRALGGDIGVDIFFVISGFVITQMMLRTKDSPLGMNLLNFYANRVRRIIPAATLVLLVTLVASFYFLGSFSSYNLLDDSRWSSLFSANLKFWTDGTDYFASSEPSLVLHFWSLGIEEQFYFVYPFIAFGLLAFFGVRAKRALLTVLLIAIAASLSFAFISEPTNPVMVFFSPQSRFWQLAAGAAVALTPFALARFKTWFVNSAAWVALAALLWLGAFDVGEQIGNTLTRLISTCAVAWLLFSGGLEKTAGSRFTATSLLAVRPIVFIGNISYSLYLWHFIWFELPRTYTMDQVDVGLFAWLLFGILASSLISYYFIENTIRHSKFLKSHPWVSLAIAPACIAAVWCAAYLLENIWTFG